jgi:hypothetical protein
MNGRPITLVPFIIMKIYDEQLKLKKRNMAENEIWYIKETFFANKVLSSFDDDVIFQLDNDFFLQGMISILYI